MEVEPYHICDLMLFWLHDNIHHLNSWATVHFLENHHQIPVFHGYSGTPWPLSSRTLPKCQAEQPLIPYQYLMLSWFCLSILPLPFKENDPPTLFPCVYILSLFNVLTQMSKFFEEFPDSYIGHDHSVIYKISHIKYQFDLTLWYYLFYSTNKNKATIITITIKPCSIIWKTPCAHYLMQSTKQPHNASAIIIPDSLRKILRAGTIINSKSNGCFYIWNLNS